jgi:hypothetical protein
MTKQGAKTTLLFVGTATVVVLSIYISRKDRHARKAAGLVSRPSTGDSAVVPGTERVAGGRLRLPRDELRKKVHGFVGNLADVQRRVTGEGEQVVARIRQGKDGLRLPDIDLTAQAPEPTMQPSPQRRP